ncbi:hypothetical protein ACJQ40_003235 [Enterococcus faecium]
MKKSILVIGFIGILMLSGCSKAKDLTEYVDVNFSGMNTQGVATYNVDTDKLLKDTLNYDGETDFPDKNTEKEIEAIENSYKIKLDKEENLSNGDKVKVTVNVDSDKTNKIKSGEKTVVVKDLEEPKKLKTQDVEKNLVVNFVGTSGRGTAHIDNMFDGDLSSVDFEIKNDGELKNGDKATINISKNLTDELMNVGYVLEKNFSPTFEVKGLDEVAEKATEIANIDDIKRMIDEGVKREYKSSEENQYSWDTQYDIKEEKLMYRQFSKDEDNANSWSDSTMSKGGNGNLIKIFTIKSYSGGTEGKLEDTKTVIFGYSNIVLNDKKEANVADITQIEDTKDDTYSLESVIKLYEGYGYTEVK